MSPEKLDSRRQDLKPDAYIRSGSIYALKRDELIVYNRRYGTENSRPYILPPERAVNVDTEIDFLVAEAQLKNFLVVNYSFNTTMKPNLLVITPTRHIDGVNKKLESFANVTYLGDPLIDSVLVQIENYDALFTNPNKSKVYIGKQLIDAGKKLQVICTASTGTNHIDKDYAAIKGVKIISLTEERDVINKISSTAEHAFALTLSSIRNIPKSYSSVLEGHWDYEKFIGRQMDGLTIGVIGYGRLGSIYSKYCLAFGSKVLVYDPFKNVDKKNIQQVNDINKLLFKSDVISIHVHATDQTKNMINRKWFNKMKSNVLIINTSRGDIIYEPDLVEFLSKNKSVKIATDVLADEIRNRNGSPLLQLASKSNQVIITPHIGGMTIEAQEIAYNHAGRLLEKYFKVNSL